jgi:hypothetical protein
MKPILKFPFFELKEKNEGKDGETNFVAKKMWPTFFPHFSVQFNDLWQISLAIYDRNLQS